MKVTDRQALTIEAGEALTDLAWRAVLRQAQDEYAPLLSPLDGRCSQRILQALFNLHPAARRPA